ncbi:hypothetical protein PGB90_009664 [Kerria lacca]
MIFFFQLAAFSDAMVEIGLRRGRQLMYSQRNQPNLNVPNVINSGISLIPYFEPSMPQNVTALVGKSAYLSCKVRNLGNKTLYLQDLNLKNCNSKFTILLPELDD